MCCKTIGKAFRLILLDLKTGVRRIWPAGTALAALYSAYWVVMLFMDINAVPEDRLPVLYLAALFFSFCVPSAVYGHINDPGKGIAYTMLPVRADVKFAVMLLVSAVVFPLSFYTGIHALDCILTAAGGANGFAGMIWTSDNGLTFGSFWSDFGKICLYQSVFVLGNILLKKHKISLTVLLMLAVHGICIGIFDMGQSGHPLPGILYTYALPAAIWILSYQCFKRMQFS